MARTMKTPRKKKAKKGKKGKSSKATAEIEKQIQSVDIPQDSKGTTCKCPRDPCTASRISVLGTLGDLLRVTMQ